MKVADAHRIFRTWFATTERCAGHRGFVVFCGVSNVQEHKSERDRQMFTTPWIVVTDSKNHKITVTLANILSRPGASGKFRRRDVGETSEMEEPST